jgi:hypothetical protein
VQLRRLLALVRVIPVRHCHSPPLHLLPDARSRPRTCRRPVAQPQHEDRAQASGARRSCCSPRAVQKRMRRPSTVLQLRSCPGSAWRLLLSRARGSAQWRRQDWRARWQTWLGLLQRVRTRGQARLNPAAADSSMRCRSHLPQRARRPPRVGAHAPRRRRGAAPGTTCARQAWTRRG